jgi:Tfp pilus assembly protein PilF
LRSDRDCEQLYRGALQHHQAGRLAEAASLYRELIAARPGLAEAHVNLGSILKHQGKLEEAVAAFSVALKLRPDYTAAHYNLGNAFKEQGRLEDAAACYHAAVAAKPEFAQAHNNLGNVFKQQGKLAEALGAYRKAIAVQPAFADAWLNCGIVLEQQGALAEAEAAYRRALAIAPDHATVHKHLGAVLCESGRTAEGLASFLHYAQAVYGPQAQARPPAPITPHKSRHDLEQRQYISGGQGADDPSITESLRLEGGARLASSAINPGNDAGAIGQSWNKNQPQLVVIDDLLTPEALQALRQLCWGSTFWRESFADGYLGTLPEHGFAVPLLAQIGEELSAHYPDIFQAHPLLQLWAFKYDSRLSGIRLHADFAAVNVNFWITPDDANLDPESGGLVVWDVPAPAGWSFAKFNDDVPAARDFLARAGARAVTIPHRANRAVIFDSDLFHKTDQIAFKDGYLNRRINVTLLYGRRETAAQEADTAAAAAHRA